MKPICVGTGWYSDSKGHNNKNVSTEMQGCNYLKNVWLQHIKRQIYAAAFVIYQSDCENKIFMVPEKNINVIQGLRPPTQHKHNDAAASMMASAMYAYCNEMSLVFIEQDCLVFGLRGAIEWARGKSIVYGTTPYADDLSRGENSFVFINYEFMPTFFERMFRLNWHVWDKSRDFPEVIWNDTFKEVGTRWPFGFGRRRPINFELPMFYAQQLTDVELKQFFIKLELQ